MVKQRGNWIEIAVTVPAMPRAMGPTFELCPTIDIGLVDFEEEPRETLPVEYGCELEFEAGIEG